MSKRDIVMTVGELAARNSLSPVRLDSEKPHPAFSSTFSKMLNKKSNKIGNVVEKLKKEA